MNQPESGEGSVADDGPFFPCNVEVARNSDNWIATGSEFVKAARVLLEESEAAERRGLPDGQSTLSDESQWFLVRINPQLTVSVCLALACELGLKALRIQQDPSVIPDEGRIRIRTHRLVQLAKDAKLEIDEDELKLLESLEVYLTWGRYPTCVNPQDYKEPWQEGAPEHHPHSGFNICEFAKPVLALWDKIRDEHDRRRSRH